MLRHPHPLAALATSTAMHPAILPSSTPPPLPPYCQSRGPPYPGRGVCIPIPYIRVLPEVCMSATYTAYSGASLPPPGSTLPMVLHPTRALGQGDVHVVAC